MQDFTTRIFIEEGFHAKFVFNGIYTVNGVRYHVSVTDINGQTYAFNMEEKNGKWTIIDGPKVPDWIVTLENKLEEAILKNG